MRQAPPRFNFGRHGGRVGACRGGRRAEDVPWCQASEIWLRQTGKAGAEKINDGSGCAIPDANVCGIMVGVTWAMQEQPSTAQAGRVINRIIKTEGRPVFAVDQPVFEALVISLDVDSFHFPIAVWQPYPIMGFNQHSGKYRNFGL